MRHDGPLHRILPAIVGASAFACADVAGKVTLNSGADVLTTVTVRSYIGLALLYAWLQVGPRAAALTPRAKWISLGLGVLLTGNFFALFQAFALIEVPVAILTYFVYPLLTGLAAAALGLEALGARGVAAAVGALVGLALMLGAHPAGLAAMGVVAALASACCRVAMLLITRASLAGVDARFITWYSFLSSTALFTACALVAWNWHVPGSAAGWLALVLLGE